MRQFFAFFFSIVSVIVHAQKPRLVVPIGHTDYITALSCSSDGKYILSGSGDKTAKLWDAKGHEIQTFRGHSEQITSVAFTQNKEFVLTTSSDNTIRLWDIQSGSERRSFGKYVEDGQLARAALSPNGKWVATCGGDDKSARVWDLETGRMVKELSGHQSNVHILAYTPNGDKLLTGTWEGETITEEGCMGCPRTRKVGAGVAKLWDVKTGNLLQSFGGHEDMVSAIGFSPVSDQFLTGDAGGTIRLWTSKSSTPVQVFNHYSSWVKNVAFSPDGKYVMAVWAEGTLKVWELATGQELEISKKVQNKVESASFLPASSDSGGVGILVGLENNQFNLMDFNGNLVQVFNGKSTDFTAVAFPPSGTGEDYRLFFSTQKGITVCDLAKSTIQVFDPVSKSGASSFPQLAFSADGAAVRMVSSAKAAEWSKNGKLTKEKEILPTRRYTTPSISPSTASDPMGGKYVALAGEGNDFDLVECWSGKVIRNFKKPEAAEKPADPNAFEGAVELSLKIEQVNALDFSPSGKYILSGDLGDNDAKLWDTEGVRKPTFLRGHTGKVQAVAFSPVGSSMLTGSSDSTAKLWDKDARLIQTFRGHTDAIYHVSFSPDGERVLTASRDRTAKIWDPQTGKCLHTFPIDQPYNFVFTKDGKFILHLNQDNTVDFYDAVSTDLLGKLIVLNEVDWVVTAPSGLFDASPGAMEIMYFIVGEEVVELNQLKERYYEPGLLSKLMGISKNEVRSVEAFNNVALYPEISATIDKNQLQITLKERGGGLGKLSLFVNGKQMNADINPGRQQTLHVDLDEYNTQYRSDVPNTIGLVAYNTGDWLKSQAFELPYKPVGARGDNTTSAPKPSECGAIKPSLYLLMIGTSNYSDASKNLTYPDLDAAEMAKALSSTGKVLFGDKVQLKLLSTAGAGVEISSKANIEKAFKEYAQKATPCDVLVVYFSGHGSTWGKEGDKSNFYYLTKDITSAKLADEAIRKAYAVSDAELTKWLAAIPAQKQVLILDACNSGKAAENFTGNGQKDLNSDAVIAFELMKDRTGTFILTGSAADMVSFESNKYGQGLLTYSLLEGMNGTALKDGRYVDIMTLFQHSRDLVPILAKSIGNVQDPVIAAPRMASSFPVGIKDASVKIELAQPKPVVIRSNFQDKNKFKDALGLTKALNDYFHAQNAKGAQAKFVFYEIDEYKDGYSVNGNYSVTGETVTVNGSLFKGENAVGEPFQITGSKDPAELVKLILKEVGPRIK